MAGGAAFAGSLMFIIEVFDALKLL